MKVEVITRLGLSRQKVLEPNAGVVVALTAFRSAIWYHSPDFTNPEGFNFLKNTWSKSKGIPPEK